jgi:hypothetical protein
MTGRRQQTILRLVSAPRREITLEVEPDSDPICGRLRHDGGTRTFCGWLELADALRAAVHSAPDRPDEPPRVDGDPVIR